METIVKVTCSSKKETLSHNSANPIQTAIEFDLPYDPNSIYYKLSGGTAIVLNTINKQAADIFTVGKEYMVTIAPVAVE